MNRILALTLHATIDSLFLSSIKEQHCGKLVFQITPESEYVAESTGDTAQFEAVADTPSPTEVLSECIVGEIVDDFEPPSTSLVVVEGHSHLHMWATDESLFAAKAVMESWGFFFKGARICLNTLGRPGNYWVEAHEYLLLGVRGGLPLMERGMNSWMRACREPDGNSPDNIRRLIERVGPGPYLYLFGHKPISGWTVYSSMAGRDFSSYPVSDGKEADDAEAASS